MNKNTENSVPCGTANVDRQGSLLPASCFLLPASEWDCICRECSKIMNDECCGMCDRREGREFYEICNECAEMEVPVFDDEQVKEWEDSGREDGFEAVDDNGDVWTYDAKFDKWFKNDD